MQIVSNLQKGKAVNSSDVLIISENNLVGWKSSGRRIRARCHFHNGDGRSLSIAAWSPEMDEDEARLAGWGHCHNDTCEAHRKPVLVKEWNPRAARRLGQIETQEPRIAIMADNFREAEKWQIDELAALNRLYPHMQARLQHQRARAYLAGRGIDGGMLDLLVQLGVGFIPPASEWQSSPPRLLIKWCDRLVFPYTTNLSTGERGFIGRALFLWQPAMDENEHKKVLEDYNERIEGNPEEKQVRRWEKTYKSGWFNAQAIQEHRHLYLCEGTFDTLPLLYAGINNVIAVAGTQIEVVALPHSVLSVTIAFDAGTKSPQKVAAWSETFGRFGIELDFCVPPDDNVGKDWSERYRLRGIEGLAPILDNSRARDHENIPAACTDCRTSIDMTDRDFFFVETSTGVACYCSRCRVQSAQKA